MWFRYLLVKSQTLDHTLLQGWFVTTPHESSIKLQRCINDFLVFVISSHNRLRKLQNTWDPNMTTSGTRHVLRTGYHKQNTTNRRYHKRRVPQTKHHKQRVPQIHGTTNKTPQTEGTTNTGYHKQRVVLHTRYHNHKVVPQDGWTIASILYAYE